MTSFNHNYFLTPNTDTLEVPASIYELGEVEGDSIYIQFITRPMDKLIIPWNLGELFTQSVNIYSVPTMCQAFS